MLCTVWCSKCKMMMRRGIAVPSLMTGRAYFASPPMIEPPMQHFSQLGLIQLILIIVSTSTFELQLQIYLDEHSWAMLIGNLNMFLLEFKVTREVLSVCRQIVMSRPLSNHYKKIMNGQILILLPSHRILPSEGIIPRVIDPRKRWRGGRSWRGRQVWENINENLRIHIVKGGGLEYKRNRECSASFLLELVP